jgi:serine/threonine protein kinase/pimeloyl-ACP methyl ester carboxylesterase
MPEVVVLDTFTPPTEFDGFAVERPLGRGGMGHVYLGRDVELDRQVALKFVAALDGSGSARERFRREARAIARLSHPNVVSIYRIGEVAEQPYIAYELVPGRSLDRTAMPLPWPIALRIAVGIARGLEAVHRAGILHRDLKPANVVLSDGGEVKLIDFGLASLSDSNDEPSLTAVGGPPSPTAPTIENVLLTRPGALLGTPPYIAPEQWCGDSASMRSDIYAFGMTVLELLTGSLPHARMPFSEIPKFLLLRELPPLRTARPDVPEAFASAVDRCLRRDPAERFASGTELRTVLETAERIFVQAGTASPAGALEVDSIHVAVASSFIRVKAQPSFARSLYTRLFELSPDVRALFPANMTAQEAKLVHMLEVAIDSLSAPESLDSMLADLGRRHVHYGAKIEHFKALWTAMLAALAEHEKDAWTPALETAWKSTLQTLEDRMSRGMEREKPTVLSEQVNVNVLRLPPPIFDLRSSPPTPDWSPPRTQYARNGDVDLAFQVFGDGPAEVVVLMGWVSHVELNWGHRALMSFLKELGRWARVVVYDKRGTGLSDRSRETASLDDHVADLVTVCEAAKASRPVLFAISDAAPLAMTASALHPEHFSGLVLYGASPKLLAGADFAHGISSERIGDVVREIENRWGEPILVDLHAPSMARDQNFREWTGLYMRMSASRTHASRMMNESAQADIRALLPYARLPALVLHRTDDQAVPIGAARYLAKRMPNARFVELDGVDHHPFVGGTTDLLERTRDFVARGLEAGFFPPAIRLVAAFHDEGDEALVALAREIAEPLRGEPLGSVSGVSGYAFTRAGHAALFLQRLFQSVGERELRSPVTLSAAIEGVVMDPSTKTSALGSIAALAKKHGTPNRAPVGPLAMAFFAGGNVGLERDGAGIGRVLLDT